MHRFLNLCIVGVVSVIYVCQCSGQATSKKENSWLWNDNVVRAPAVSTTVSVVSHLHVAELGEGPSYVTAEKALYYVDINLGEVCRLDPATGQVSRRYVGDRVSVVIPYHHEPGNFIISPRNELYKLNWQTGTLTYIATAAPELGGLERFNDGKCDPRGRLFLGTLLEDENGVIVHGGGNLYRLDGGDILAKVASGYDIPNGMAFSNDNASKLYLNDSEGGKIYVFDYDVNTGSISNQRVLVDTSQHADFNPGDRPDGMAIDAYGYIWVSLINAGRVVRINPETAAVVHSATTTNARNPTSVAFGDYQGQYGLYVTTAARNFAEPDRLDDGKILHINVHGGNARGFLP